MCLGIGALTSIAGLAIGVMQIGVQQQAAQDAADRQNAYYERNALAAQRAAINTYASQQNKIIQERAAANQEIMETRVAALRGRSTARVAAGEAGVSGLSVDALVGDYYGREGRRIESIDSNYQMTRDYLRAEMESTRAHSESRINSVRRAAPPSFADAGLRIAGLAVKTVGSLMRGGGPTSTMSFAT